MKLHIFILIIQIISLKCFSHSIPNCEAYDNNKNTCTKCRDKYFPLFHNLFCIACDDKDYGQIGCGGNCDGSNFINDRVAYCKQNGCKEGYYYLEGLCLDCNMGSPGCKECIVNKTQNIDGQIYYNYTCLECLSNEYKLDINGTCQKCEMNYCLECSFAPNNSEKECLQCDQYSYLTTNKTCKICNYIVSLNGGYCRSCFVVSKI